MSNVNTTKLVAALRDVVTKAHETQTVVSERSAGQWSSEPPKPYETEKYTREYIVGRIAGLADAIETMSAP